MRPTPAAPAAAPRRAAEAELPSVAEILSRAFADDPMWAWALGRADAADRRARLERFFGALLDRVHARHELVYVVDGAGAAVWTPPGQWHISLADQARVAPAVLRAFGGGVVRLLRLLAAVERAHLREPHYYLFAIGTVPEQQGRGIGASLLAPLLARCDAERLPAYLESSTPTNLPFYRRHGFEAQKELRFGADVCVTCMRRDPRRAS